MNFSRGVKCKFSKLKSGGGGVDVPGFAYGAAN